MAKDKEKSRKKDIDKKSNKISRISTAIANMSLGETISPTRLFRSIGVHPDTGRDLLDMFDSLKEIGFVTLRDKNGKVREVLRTDESLDTRKDIIEIKKQILELKGFMDELKTILKKRGDNEK